VREANVRELLGSPGVTEELKAKVLLESADDLADGLPIGGELRA